MQKIRTNEDELFKKLITRKAEFVKNIGQEKVDRFISGIYFAKLFPYACGTTPYDGNLMVDLALELHKCNLPDTNGGYQRITQSRAGFVDRILERTFQRFAKTSFELL